MDNATYHADKTAISKSGLDLIAKSPAHFRYWMDHTREETPAMQKGTLIHTMALEPEKVGEEYAVMPPTIKQRRGKEYEAFLSGVGSRTVLTASQMEDARQIVSAIEANPIARKIIADATDIERSVFSEDFETGVLCKCRPDLIVGNRIYDLKTTRNANAKSFAYSCRSYRYHVQAAFYMDVCRWAGLDIESFGFIAVDTDTMPYQCTVFHRLIDEAVTHGRADYRDDLKVYAQCLESGEWPGYPESYDELSMAGYAYDFDPEEQQEDA